MNQHHPSLRIVLTCAGAITLLLATGCSRSPPQAAAPAFSPYFVDTTVREIMDAEVDPAADALWEAVSFNSTLSGPENIRPQTPEDWQVLRRNAITLIEATNLIVMPGRRIAPASVALAPGELNPTVLQHKLDHDQAKYQGYALALRTLGLQALAAVDARNPQQLFDVGGEIDEVCESCHVEFWYPPNSDAPKH
jgi:hypothetical protein